MKPESRKEALHYFFAKAVDPLGYKFTPDGEMMNALLDAEVELEKQSGSPFCPCQGRGQSREENMQVVCPCIPYHKEYFDHMRRCWCGLFVHKDVEDPQHLPQIAHDDYKRWKDAH